MATRGMALAALLGAAAASTTLTVRREGVRLMKAPRFFGEPCPEPVAAGDEVAVLERRGGWARVAEPGSGRCWLHESAWVDREPGELGGGDAASERDVELAARGFSEEEEVRYRAEHQDLTGEFEVVDAYLERAPEAPARDLAAFVAAGKLGGAR